MIFSETVLSQHFFVKEAAQEVISKQSKQCQNNFNRDHFLLRRISIG